MSDGTITGFDYFKLIIENVSLWEVMVLGVLIWLARNPELLKQISRFKIGDLEIELQQLKQEVEEKKEEIQTLETQLENERLLFGEILEGFDPYAPVEDLNRTKELLKAHARTLSDLDELKNYLTADASAEELYAAAVTFRERRPTHLIAELLNCIERLAEQPDLGDIRLNTVWTLTSALHRTLIASVRDGATPTIPKTELERAKRILGKLEVNPRVLDDRPDHPEKGIRGPIKYSLRWINQGLSSEGSTDN